MPALSRAAVRISALVIGTLLVGLALAGCGTERSTAAFCAVQDRHKARYLSAMKSATEDENLLQAVLKGAVAISDLNQMWQELADVAPEDNGLRADAEAVAEFFEKQADRTGEIADNPLKGVVSGLAGALTIAAPLQRVDAFVRESCD